MFRKESQHPPLFTDLNTNVIGANMNGDACLYPGISKDSVVASALHRWARGRNG